jgi:hypothetical protein
LNEQPPRGGWRRELPVHRTIPVLVAVAVLVLALAALLLPRATGPRAARLLVVVDPLHRLRGEEVYPPLVEWLESELGRALQLAVVGTPRELAGLDLERVDLVVCPDGVALGLPPDAFASVALGRRLSPYNLRARGVLVRRRSAPPSSRPWLDAPGRTILGDSLTLAGCGVLHRKATARGSRAARGGGELSFGPDPFDHAPALHALRTGCFDYAVVREHTARRFLAADLLDPLEWDVEELTPPLPGIVVLVRRQWPAARKVRLGEVLVGLGRRSDRSPPEDRVLHGLAALGLDGFNLLLEPDFELVRRQFDPCWPAAVN